jgi:hypothetical protein
MKIKVKDLVMCLDKLTALSKKDLPPKLSYRVSKNMKKVTAEVQTIDEKRVEFIKKQGAVEGANGGYELIPPTKPAEDAKKKEREEYEVAFQAFKDKIAAFTKDVNELMDEEIDLDIMTLNMSLFTDDIRVPADILVALDFMIED